MAVFPDRIVLKNSTDSQAAIEAAIQTGGTDEITQGEIVLGLEVSSVSLYTKASDGSIVRFAPGTAAGRAIVSDTAPTVGINSLPLVDGDLWYESDTGSYYVYYQSSWVEVSGGGSVTSIDDLSDVDTTTVAPTDGQVLIWNNVDGEWQPDDLSVDALSDVDTTTAAPVDGQALVWNNSASKWEPGGVSGEIEWTLTANGTTDYIFAGAGFAGTETDPAVYVMRGQTYRFTNGMGAHPFQIQSTQGVGGTAYNDGITNNAVSSGTLVWEVRMDAPSTLYYQCTSHADMNGTIYVLDESGSVASIDDLSDVDTTTVAPTDGQALVWDNANSKWEPGTVAGGTVASLDNVGDVDTTTVPPTDGQALVWDNANSQWEPGTVSGGGAVDSVNGETGVVSLGIQDQDDVDVYTVLGTADARNYNSAWPTGWPDIGTDQWGFGTKASLGGIDEPEIVIDDTPAGTWVPPQWNGSNLAQYRFTFNGSMSFVLWGRWVYQDGGARYIFDVTDESGSPAQSDYEAVRDTVLAAGTPTTLVVEQVESNLSDGSVLQWNDTDQKFKPAQLGVDDLADADTSTTAPTDGQVLTWVAANSQWEPGTVAGGTVASIDDIGDVDTTTSTPSDGQTLVWNNTASQWEPGSAGGAASVPFDAILKYTSGDAANPGEWQYWSNYGANDVFLSFVDNTGVDATSMFEHLDDSNSVTHIWHSGDSGATWTKREGTFAIDAGLTFYNFNSATGEPFFSGDQWFSFADPTQPNRISSNVDVDTSTTAPTNGQALTWVAANSQWEPADLQGAAVRAALGIGEYVDDAAAGTGGVASGAMYYNTTSSDYRLKT